MASRTRPRAQPVPAPTPTGLGPAALISSSLALVAALLLGFVAVVALLGSLHHGRDQDVAFAELRKELANGTAPLGAIGNDGKPIAAGSPVALLEAPEIGLREVVAQGTGAGQLRSGPGHRPDTAFPGQGGTSVVMGRRAAYGGPFAKLDRLRVGSRLKVTTGQGVLAFSVIAVRRAGDLQSPLLATGRARLTLLTASGPAYLPAGVLAVDADLDTAALPSQGSTRVASAADLPLAADSGALVPLVLWLQALLIAGLGLAWARQRWGHWQTWLVGIPVLAWIGSSAADQAACLLPNLM